MPFHIEFRLEGFFSSQSSVPGQSTDLLNISWKASRRVFQRTNDGILPPPADEPLGPSASALFGFRLGSASDLHPQIRLVLESLNFAHSVTRALCPRITAFAISLAGCSSGPPYPSIIVFAHLNFIEKLYVDSIDRSLTATGWVDGNFDVGTSTEDWSDSDDEEGAEEDNKGASDSVIETLRRRKLESRGVEESCSICMETFSDGEEVIPLRCEHMYHESCIVTWLKKSQSCPLCRRREI